MNAKAPTLGAEATATGSEDTRHDSAFEIARRRWRQHLAHCQPRRPRVVLEYGRRHFEEAS